MKEEIMKQLQQSADNFNLIFFLKVEKVFWRKIKNSKGKLQP